ncbi:hypothetical protein LS74_004450 [Helicobacter magdeburgensis]|uniref:Lipoprotein n=1 Tax=Helicobacter magdeburgensis TaxID=471858 RepID=A0A4V6I1L7_9HELI|nr:hypothetical protein [Helicobacter magdeburgensis]TLD92592.1 hypothetical protein LS74_004450 [Helicobacter magdeburgensis]
MKNVCVVLMLIGVLTGCANLKRHAASATGCNPKDIVISQRSFFDVAETYVATCNGEQYYCTTGLYQQTQCTKSKQVE